MSGSVQARGALYDDAGRMVGRGGMPFTDEQADAIRRREGSLLLSANAGSGKTSVLSERFVRSVLEDDVEPGRILAITFTDKAAGELRTRVRGRFVELGRRDRARDLDAAWISTFHGLCARILRAHAVRAGLDPAFGVLEEAEARDVRGVAFERALAEFLGRDRPEALDLVAAYGVDALQLRIVAAHDQLRSSGMTRPALPRVSVTPPDAAALSRALAAADAELAVEDTRRSIAGARTAVGRCRELLTAAARGEAPELGALAGAAFKPGNTKALKGDGCAAYLEALATYASGWQDALAAAAIVLLDELLGRYADAYAEAKRERAALDFDDLELLARDLLGSAPAVRAAYAARFERVMVDEFQDTNATQLDLLELLGGDRFVVGDELQSIYGFRHADVRIFRAQRAALAQHGAAAELAANFRSRPDILGVLDAAMGELHGGAHVPFVAGRDDEGQLDGPLVELLLTDADAVEAWPAEALASLPSTNAKRRAEARVVAARVAALIRDEGVSAADVVVLLRAATDMAVFERALEEEGLSTLAAGGRGYWGRQQVLDLCAYLGALANPRDELALFGLLASPLVGLSADGLAILARTARQGARWDALAGAFCAAAGGETADAAEPSSLPGLLPDGDRDALANFCPWFAGERARAPRLGLDELLERVVDRTGYDLHVLGLPGGRRRWANVLKLQRLASGFEARRGRDVRGLIDLATAELEAEARETDAPVELGDATAVRLMTMHAAKGLEFGVVVIADLGRTGRNDTDDLLVRGDRIGLRLRTVDGASAKTLDWEALRDEQQAADAEEERRILHVAMTRAEERLIVSGTFEPDKWLGAPQPAVAPLRWLAPRLAAGLAGLLEEDVVDGTALPADPDPAAVRPRVSVTVHREPPPPAAGGPAPVAAEAAGPGVAEAPAPATEGGQLTMDLFAPVEQAAPVGRAAAAPGRASLPAPAGAVPAPPPRPLPATLSYTSLAAYDRCAYRWYLERVLRLPPDDAGAAGAAARPPGPVPDGLDALMRGSLAHALLEELDFAAPAAPSAEAVRATATLRGGVDVTDADVADLQQLVAAFADSPLAARLAAAPDVRREHGFVVGLGDDAAPLLNGFIDVLAFEEHGGALIVDYKSDVVAPGADLEAHVEADYGAQRRIYALAALGAGAPDVEVSHLFLARPQEPATAVYDRNDMPRLRAELDALIAGIAAGEFAPTDRPHRSLCATCPGRRALCWHGEELTLREEPTPVG
ncbi:MAG: ATP-dependent helicase/nuclease subunit [Baekduia sp.]|nr:ATP-dependent helicase/nuclease subunit [Baekduia sp.]